MITSIRGQFLRKQNFRFLLFLLLLSSLASLLPTIGAAQTLSGTLTDDAGQQLIGGTVLGITTNTGTTTDLNGAWVLDATGNDTLQFSYVGYVSQRIAISDLSNAQPIVLSTYSLDELIVTGRKLGNYTSTLDPRNVESITSTELKKAPCCNLGESFETNAAVDVSYRDAATGAREMQVLGLRGVYSQLLVEKRPTLYGLATAQALDYIPGTWIDGIQIGKGASSVQTGTNALSGQVNTELVKPFDSDPLFVNLFAGGFGRVEANVHLAEKWNDKSSTGLLLHGSNNPASHDRDRDGFYEQPSRETFSGMARHFYRTNNWRAQINVWGTRDRRVGGQTDHDKGLEHGPQHGGARYVINQANNRVEAFAKTGYLGFARPNTSAGLIAGASHHKLDNAYGQVLHNATQQSGYVNALYSSYLKTTAHTYTVGLSYTYDDYQEVYNRANYDRTETAGGAFAEYTYDFVRGTPTGKGLYGASVIAGLRVDNHSVGGWQALPRLNLKVNPTEDFAIRASAGRAYRSPQVIAENIRLLTSSRIFEIIEPLRLETGWNYGVALTKNFSLHYRGNHSGKSPSNAFEPNGSFTLDAYATVFDNLAVVDQEQRIGRTTVANATGPAQTYSVLGSVRVEVLQGLEFKAAYKYVKSEQTYSDGIKRAVPYVANWRGLFSTDYELPSKRWRINTNLQIVGPQRLPGETSWAELDVSYEDLLIFESPVFALLSAQTTYVVNDRLEIYAGGENLTNYRQSNSVIGAGNEDVGYFDTSRTFAPLMGAMPYAGMRYSLSK